MSLIGEKIYNLLVEKGVNPIDFLRTMSISFPDVIDEHDIDHRFGLDDAVEILHQPLPSIMDYSIQLNDGLECHCFFVSDNKIYTKSGILVGYCNDWVDDDLEIPERYKNTDNAVLHPITKNGLLEYFLCSSSQPYHDLQTDALYREFKYDYGLDNLVSISSAIRVNI